MDTPPPTPTPLPPPGTLLGELDTLPDGVATMGELPTEPGSGEAPFRYVLLRSGTEVKAYVNRCAHFGVPLAARQDLLIFVPHTSITCNVHYARYRWSDGTCVSGECDGVGLLAIPVVVDTLGQICVAPSP
ncbi:Rieske (2Fe-2S) protein [Rhodoferax sp.]|uniref:Rieske (2Fe-2S) protein n=1 Tax=Rhodoferax sp. TaxID=50421 RepID=UPI002ACEBE9B|nr:Rieske 2Fe-2S domain-containing protein [Rhodoferax sp.]MDZ7920330.1 Rieske 2Fe-2S domain-containing protein [Rhodoferax sp.]